LCPREETALSEFFLVFNFSTPDICAYMTQLAKPPVSGHQSSQAVLPHLRRGCELPAGYMLTTAMGIKASSPSCSAGWGSCVSKCDCHLCKSATRRSAVAPDTPKVINK
jgi:hypothetical protein